MEEHNEIVLKTVDELLGQGDRARALDVLAGVHGADAAEILLELPREEQVALFEVWDPEESAPALAEMPEDVRAEIVEDLELLQATRILEESPPDEAADILGHLNRERREAILDRLGLLRAGSIRKLLQHGEKTAGGLMTPEAARLSEDLKVSDVIERLRRIPENVEMVYYLYFEDEEEGLTGAVSLRELIVADAEAMVRDIMHKDLITVGTETDQEEVARLIDRYDLLAVPVIDGRGRMLGIVTVDDVMDVIEEEAKEDIYSLAGTFETEETRERSPFLAAIRGRAPWLLVALLAEVLLAAGILRAYSDVMQAHIALVFFIPVVMTMGGTIAVMNSTRVVRDYLGGEPMARRREFFAESAREIGIASIMGIMVGVVMALIAWAAEGDARLGLVVGLSLTLTMIVAAVAGSLLPLILKALRLDPAKSSGPLLATLMDILALLLYFAIGISLIG